MRDEFDELLASLSIEPVKKPEIEYQEPLVVKPTNDVNQNTDLTDFGDVLSSVESSNNSNVVSNTVHKEYVDIRNLETKNESDIDVPDLVDTMNLEEAPSLINEHTDVFNNQETQEVRPRGYEVPDIKGSIKRVPDIDNSENSIYRLETEYIDVILSYEEELKDLKRRFKLNTLEYQSKGVQTRLVIKAVKQAAKDAKKEGYIIKDENRIQERINNDSDLLGRICTIINSAI